MVLWRTCGMCVSLCMLPQICQHCDQVFAPSSLLGIHITSDVCICSNSCHGSKKEPFPIRKKEQHIAIAAIINLTLSWYHKILPTKQDSMVHQAMKAFSM